jgi:hypothetical protein
MKFKDTLVFPELSIPIELFLSRAYELFNSAVQTFNPKESKEGRKETEFEQFVAEQLFKGNSVHVYKLKESLKQYITWVYQENAKKLATLAREKAIEFWHAIGECFVSSTIEASPALVVGALAKLMAPVAESGSPPAEVKQMSPALVVGALAKLMAPVAESGSPPAEVKQIPALERWRFDNGLFKTVSNAFPGIRFAIGVNDVLEDCAAAASSESGQCQHDFRALASDIKAYNSNSEKFVDIIRHVLLKNGGLTAIASAEPEVIAVAEAAEATANSALKNEERSSLLNWNAFLRIGEWKKILPNLAAILIKAILSQNGGQDELFFVACHEQIEEFEAMKTHLKPHLKSKEVHEIDEKTWNSVQKFDQDRLWLNAYTKFSKKPSDDGSSSGAPVVGGRCVVSSRSDGGGGGGGGGADDASIAAAQERKRNSQQNAANTANKYLTIETIRRLHEEIRSQLDECLKFDSSKGTDIQALETFKFFLQDEWFHEVGIELCVCCTDCVLQCGLWCNACVK